LATAAMLMANHGKWHQPAMVRRIGLAGEDVQHPSSYPDIKLNNEDDWTFIGHAMAEVVHKGTGGYRNTGTAYASLDGAKKLAYTMAGKSGTAQVAALSADHKQKDKVAEDQVDNALFIAYAPVENPQIAVAVYIEHGEHGSSTAGPIARKIIDAYLLGEDGRLKPEFAPNNQSAPPLISSTAP
jgi:penicillin-binding protein 2